VSSHRLPRMGSCIGEADRLTMETFGGPGGVCGAISLSPRQGSAWIPRRRLRVGCGSPRATPRRWWFSAPGRSCQLVGRTGTHPRAREHDGPRTGEPTPRDGAYSHPLRDRRTGGRHVKGGPHNPTGETGEGRFADERPARRKLPLAAGRCCVQSTHGQAPSSEPGSLGTWPSSHDEPPIKGTRRQRMSPDRSR
jgi:hypothetical protein